MSEIKTDPQLTDHCYDGIEEYDNPIPSWWSWLFAGSVVFSIFYWLYFHSGVEGRSVIDQYTESYAANLRKKFAGVEFQGDAPTLIRLYQKQYDQLGLSAEDSKVDWLKTGEATFLMNCTNCHVKDGGGANGPNLTDDAYKNVRKIEDLVKVIQDGANNGAMPAWRGRLHPNEVVLVAAYVASLRGTSPANPKPAEGNVIAAWPTEVGSESDRSESDSGVSDPEDSEVGDAVSSEGGDSAAEPGDSLESDTESTAGDVVD